MAKRYEIKEATVLLAGGWVDGYQVMVDGRPGAGFESRQDAESYVARQSQQVEQPRRSARRDQYSGAAAAAAGGDLPDDPIALRRYLMAR